MSGNARFDLVLLERHLVCFHARVRLQANRRVVLRFSMLTHQDGGIIDSFVDTVGGGASTDCTLVVSDSHFFR
jgi:hypothetical protein